MKTRMGIAWNDTDTKLADCMARLYNAYTGLVLELQDSLEEFESMYSAYMDLHCEYEESGKVNAVLVAELDERRMESPPTARQQTQRIHEIWKDILLAQEKDECRSRSSNIRKLQWVEREYLDIINGTTQSGVTISALACRRSVEECIKSPARFGTDIPDYARDVKNASVSVRKWGMGAFTELLGKIGNALIKIFMTTQLGRSQVISVSEEEKAEIGQGPPHVPWMVYE